MVTDQDSKWMVSSGLLLFIQDTVHLFYKILYKTYKKPNLRDNFPDAPSASIVASDFISEATHGASAPAKVVSSSYIGGGSNEMNNAWATRWFFKDGVEVTSSTLDGITLNGRQVTDDNQVWGVHGVDFVNSRNSLFGSKNSLIVKGTLYLSILKVCWSSKFN